MDDQSEESVPPPDAGESAGGGQSGQAAGDGPATPLLSAVGKQQATIVDANGRFLPGVLQPASRPWRPGQSGNPAGYSKAGRVTRRLVAALEKDDGKLADALTTVILKKALTGDYRFVQELVSRVEGKVADRLAGHDGGPLSLPAITVVKSYAGQPPVGEAGAEEQQPQPPETAQLPALPASPEPSAAGDALAAKIRLLRGAAPDTEPPLGECGI